MKEPLIVTAWEAVFYCSFDVLVTALRAFMLRLRSRFIRPLAFGFVEFADGSNYIDFQEQQHDEGAIFAIMLVRYNQETQKRREDTLGVLLLYMNQVDKTKIKLRCWLDEYGNNIDNTIEIVKHFAEEARGHAIIVERNTSGFDFTRDFIISITLNDIRLALADFNQDLKAFGYWIEIPDQVSEDDTRSGYIILKTEGVNPNLFTPPGSPFDREEVGMIECLQIKDKTY